MKSGTNVNEITESLPNGVIVRLLGNGWRPRTQSLELIDEQIHIRMADFDSIKALHVRLGEFIAAEKIQEKKDAR